VTPYDYQERSIEHLRKVLLTEGAAVDGSDMGTGKTLVAVETVRRLDLPGLAILPKATIPGWQRTLDAQRTELDLLNYEMLRTGRTPYGEWRAPDLWHPEPWFKWHPGIKLLFFDEGHRCKGYQTKNSELMKAARRQGILTVAMSATLADNPMEMDALGYLLRLHDSDSKPTMRNPAPLHFLEWARRYGCDGNPIAFDGGTEHMTKINQLLYPRKGVRVRIEEIPGFPEIQITAELYNIEAPGRLDAIHKRMEAALKKLKERTDNYWHDPLSEITKERQEAELLKVPLFVDLTRDAQAQGKKVAIFVSFQATLQALCHELKTNCTIDGSQTGTKGMAIREQNRLAFVEDRRREIICINEAGGVGLDLPDIYGNFPCLSLVSAGFDAKMFRQVCGRTRRAISKTKSLVRVIFAAGTIEEGVHRSVSGKLNNLDALNDGDLMPGNLRHLVDVSP
jgi:hypothetical protein